MKFPDPPKGCAHCNSKSVRLLELNAYHGEQWRHGAPEIVTNLTAKWICTQCERVYETETLEGDSP